MEFSGTARFALSERIGEGGMGVVYQAHDLERDAVVALKVMRRVDPAALLRFKREFRALADVSHPNLVSLYELVSTDDHWFFTMELIDGCDFLAYVRGQASADEQPSSVSSATPTHAMAAGPDATPATLDTRRSAAPLDTPTNAITPHVLRRARSSLHPPLQAPPQYDRLRDALRQLATGVHALHELGKLHRDLKPSNVLVDRDGRVVILDFGIVEDLAPHRWSAIDTTARLVGTPGYMAPEQAGSQAVDEAADWYAVGVMLYEALCGHRPFQGPSREVMEQKQRRDAPAPTGLARDAPRDLVELTMGLLARRADARPTGRQVLEWLGARGSERPGALNLPAAGSWSTMLLGRDAHLATLRRVFAEVAAGACRAVLVHGESGMGKSALTEHFLHELEADGEALVLSGRCYERETVPYKALDSLIDGLSRHLYDLPAAEAAALAPDHCGPLARLFPVLRRVQAFTAAARREDIPQDPHELRLRAFEALRELLRRLAAQRPLVLHIDDGQWGDVDSATLLASVLREPAPPVMLALSYRSEHAESSSFLRMARATLPHAVDLPVTALTSAQADELAAALLRHRGVAGADRQVAAIARESAGNPFLITALVGYVTAPAAAPGRSHYVNVITFDEVLHASLEQLPDEARHLLEVIAFAGRPLSQHLVLRAAQIPRDGVAAIAALRAASLIRTGGARERDWIECFHDRIREAVVAYVDDARARARHAALAACLEATTEADLQTLAAHYEGAGDGTRAGEYYARAAEQAMTNLAFDRAAALYERSRALRPVTGGALAELEGKRGDALTHAGRGRDAAEAYARAADHADPASALRYRGRAAEELLRSGRIDEGLQLFDRLLQAVNMKLPRTRGAALRSHLWGRLRVRLHGMRLVERDASELSPVEQTRLDLVRTAASVLGMTDNALGAAFQTRYLLEAMRTGERRHLGQALGLESAYAAIRGPRYRDAALALSERAIEVGRRAGDSIAIAHALFGRAMVDFQCGRWRVARETAEAATHVLRSQCTDYGFGAAATELCTLWSVNYMGNMAELRQRVMRLLREGEARGDLYLLTNVSIGMPNTAWLLFGEVAEARRRNAEAIGRWSRRNYHLQHYWGALGAIQADLFEGHVVRARDAMLEQVRKLKTAHFIRIALMRAQAYQLVGRLHLATAAAGVDRRAMLRAAARDCEVLAREDHPLARACEPLQRAGVAYLRGDREAAAEHLRDAARTGEALEMAFHTHIARRQLGAVLGGDEGAALIAAADAWMRGQGIVDPARTTDFMAPGFHSPCSLPGS